MGLGDRTAQVRKLRVLTVLVLAVGPLAGCGGDDAASAPAPGSTLDATLVDRDGDGALERGPGEPLRDRTELGCGGAPGEVLATFAQITDAHVRDEESPARVPFLDRLGSPFTTAFRPQESLSAQVLAASVRSVNRLRPQAVAVTGDLVDNAQGDELDLAASLLDGGCARPDTGAPGYDGVQQASNPDPLIYRPDNDAPRRPGLLEQAQRSFDTPGLDAPWYPAAGNHDLLAQGEAPPTPQIQTFATGSTELQSLDPNVRADRDTDPALAVDELLSQQLPGRTRSVPADPARRLVTEADLLRRFKQPGRDGRLDYTFDIGPSARAIVLDAVDREGGSRGRVLATQLGWLRDELARAGERSVVVFSHQPLDASDGGEAALQVLDRSPRVVAAIAGHRHRNRITPRREGGYWLIETSALADHPQQTRAFRLRRAPRGVVLETWMLDHDGRGLAGAARELAFLDAQGGRPRGLSGAVGDRNARLYVPGGGSAGR